MPFDLVYHVNFSSGNLRPKLNRHGWPDMQLTMPPPDDFVTSSDSEGRTLTITRRPTAPAGTVARISVYLVPPNGIPVDGRLLMRATFDTPSAEGLPLAPLADHGPLDGPLGSNDSVSLDDHGPLSSELAPDESESPGGVLSVPEPWAVQLSVSPTTDLSSESLANMSCQFHRQFNGVRLHTPIDPQQIGALQTDRATPLESPLDYSIYKGGFISFPDGLEGEVPPPHFTLEHSFCGWNAATNRHTVGSGSLKIARTWRPEVRDHRVYSSNSLTSSTPTPSHIRALGVSLSTWMGVGQIGARLRSFSLWLNASL